MIERSTAAFQIAEFKAAGDPEHSGMFAARVSAFGNEDLNGDRVMPKAFDRTLADWRAKGAKIPLIWSHMHEDPESFMGGVDPNDVRINSKGVTVAGRFEIDTRPRAAAVFDLMKKGLITAWSFAFTVPPGGEKIAKDGVREISDLDLFEVGPTLIGANPEAQTIALKSGLIEAAIDNKRGARISAATATTLQSFRDALAEMQATLDGLLGAEAAADEGAPITEAERLRLSLAEIDAFLSERDVA
ncbi:MAG: HK97 family phage prohead protease [Actinomycetota bacterium]